MLLLLDTLTTFLPYSFVKPGHCPLKIKKKKKEGTKVCKLVGI